MFWIALAAQLSAPVPTNVGQWFSYTDVPVSWLQPGEPRVASIRVTVSPTGTMRSCQIEITSGDPKIDDYTCDLTRKRARFRPATLANGATAWGVFRMPVVWQMMYGFGTPPRAPSSPDLLLTVNQLPKGVRSPANVRVMFEVDERGRSSNCAAEPNAGIPKRNEQLAPVACQQLIAEYKGIPVKGDSGQPVPSVQDALVTFVVSR